MGHRNTLFTGHMIDMQNDQQGRLQPEPCIFYGNAFSFPQPNVHPPVVPASGNRPNFNFHPMYGMTPLNGIQPHHPGPNLDLANATPAGHYNSNPYFLRPPSANFIVQPNHGNADADGVAGIFKGKNMEGVHGNLQHQNHLVGASSTVAPSSDSEQVSMVQGGFTLAPVALPWLDLHFRASNGDVGVLRWVYAPLPHGRAVDLSASNRSSGGFLIPHLAHGCLNPHHPPPPVQGIRGYNILNLPSQISVTPPRQISTINPSNTGISHIQEGLDFRPAFVAPLPPMGFSLYRPQQRELMLDSTVRPLTLPPRRVLPEDESTTILDIPGYPEAGNLVDHHRDMRLEIDHMSYEELLELGEQIGSVDTGLPNKLVRKKLKAKTFTSSAPHLDSGEETCPDQQIYFCVICQTFMQNEYERGEKIGTLDCGHEYHKDCISKWLLVKNTCPICKSPALRCKSKPL